MRWVLLVVVFGSRHGKRCFPSPLDRGGRRAQMQRVP
jgi:hypothetical protein